MNPAHDVPLLRGTFTIRSPRSVLLLNPFQLPIVFAIAVTAVIFTIFPEVLEHSPVSFEQRGVVHHVWHYSLLLASVLTLIGMVSAGRRRLQVELVGICLLVATLGINLVALVADKSISGLNIALCAGVIVGFIARAVIVATEPTVDLAPSDG